VSYRWEDTIDTQVKVMRHLDRVLRAPALYVTGRGEADDADTQFAAYLTSVCAELLADATPIYVAPEMAAIWRAAEPEFEPEPFRESDLIVRSGLALLSEGTEISRLITDEPGQSPETGDLVPARIRALLWGPAKDGEVAIVGLGYPDDQPEGMGMTQIGAHVWAPILHDAFVVDGEFKRHDNYLRAAQAFFALMRQFVPMPEKLPRARRRAAQRDGRPTEVKIMRLRRVQSRPSDELNSPVDWSCRWVVEGHWRNQWYPSLGEHRQKWIAGYVKGPEGKPLRDPQRVMGLVR
jgi:hypothetical protein